MSAVPDGTAPYERAHAKINLFLHVVGRRADGYHELDSLAVFAGAHDRLEVSPAAEIGFGIAGPFGAALAGENPDTNLVVRAARALRTAAGIEAGCRLLLEKNLPVASGIGGGSADAAAALRLLCRFWAGPGGGNAVRLEHAARRLAASLGADVPVCLAQRPARMGGIGEVLTPAPVLPSCGMVLVNCGVGVSTPAVFRARARDLRPAAVLPAGWSDAAAMAATLSTLHNDLEPAALSLCPPIGGVLSAIAATAGCRLARMSGSGATCFGLFDDAAAAARAAAALRRPGWWVWGGAPRPAAGEADEAAWPAPAPIL